MMVSRAAVDDLPTTVGGIGANLWRPALAAGGLAAQVVDGGWREVGTPTAYLGCAIELLAGASKIDTSAAVDLGVALDECLIGRGARVEAGAELRRSVVAEEARVGRGARVEDAVLLGHVEVAPGERVTGEVWARGPGGRDDRRG
jgi:NDP-sugar pyrophosphorylase family protein